MPPKMFSSQFTAGGGGAGSGTVTSVGLQTEAVLFTVSGSPVTTSGTIGLTLNTQTQNLFFGGPISGSPATPTFRALSGADLPSPIGVTLGGTGQTTWTAYAVITGSTVATGPLQQVGSIGSSGQVLTSNGAGVLPVWAAGGGGGGSPSGTNQFQWNNGGAFAGVTNSNASDASGYVFPRSFNFNLPGPRVVQTDNTPWVIMNWTGKITKAWAIAKTGPTGATFIFDILKSTNNGTGFTSIWFSTPANRLNINPSSVNNSQTSFDGATFAAGDLYRVDIAQVGSTIAGSDISVYVSTVTQNT